MGQSRTIRHDDREKVTAEDGLAVIAAVKEFRDRTGTKDAAIARSINVSGSVMSQVMRQNYNGDWQSVILDLDRWLEDAHKREAAPKPTEFVWTSVAVEIRTVAEATATLGCLGLVYDRFGSGIGKTITLQAIHADKPGSLLISIETANANPTGVLRALCRAAILQYTNSNSRGVLFEKLVAILDRTNRLILIDEAHKLTDKGQDDALNVLRDLHDRTKVPILFSATTDLRGYLDQKKAKGREPLAQIASRIGVSRDLRERAGGSGNGGKGEPLFSAEEIRNVFRKSAMRLAPDAVQYLAVLANLPDEGALRVCKNLVVMATKLNEKTSQHLTADMLRMAGRMLANRGAFELLEARLVQSGPRMTKVG